ncbi:MAG: aquaporin [Microcoleus sp. PH2017_29_MFU_D_A]|uniref:MIP/aquaporin family protein n=1 Tax=unclassified Microcoleus TaxID=2642155 RepID=UPI001D56E8E3|nr:MULTISPECIES: aquaporin [unclassified Microcoleus]MCC3445358.1 aquaporin [Microcoleus sp. PH2017_03_ELD_O_A]MCC3469796.1 aquaporin [Microcoleus sp. PH2017_06_SFM_O_A]MCC3507478.1 aquaporin [Microcoleus sp. PH2017_19_SFW_U_A]MCC3513416.1 aquaporin [Microcoleus sp. PH2017_17_BER_D_A]TAE06557.1 MAG: aquaporin family protein [Oscillatoriales cyanobacterium]
MTTLKATFRNHLPEYLMEAALLGLFLIAAGGFSILFEYPQSPVHQAIANGDLRRFLVGIVMGLTAIALIHSPWGQQSGAHMNPAVTLTFYRLGKVKLLDALFYVLFQCLGGLAGIYLVAFALGQVFIQPPINYIVTVPGALGWLGAVMGEWLVAFVMMMMVLFTSNHQKLHRYTGLLSGFLVMLYITFEAPLSGFSMNPARSLASALPANVWTDFWLYVIVPPIGMLSAAGLYTELFGDRAVKCAKLHHDNPKRCIFRCNYDRDGRVDLSDRLLK